MSETIQDIISLQNIDSEDFEFTYDKRPYYIPAGAVRRFPRFLAEHALKHLIDKILNRQDIKTSLEDKRADLSAKIVVGTESLDQPPVKTEADILDETVADLNKPSDLDNVLKRNQTREKVKGKDEDTTTETVEEPEEDFVGKPVEPTTTTPAPAKPTRAELFTYAKDTLKMELEDPKTKKALEKLTVDELIKEFDYPYPPEE